MASGGDRFHLWFADEHIALASLGNVSACVMRGKVTMERLRDLRRESLHLVDRWGEQRGGITVVEPSAVGDVPRDVRHESAALIRDFPTLASATVIEGRGFVAVAARAILTGMRLLARTGDSNRVFDAIPDAAAWVAGRVPLEPGLPRPTVSELAAMVERTRAAIRRP